MATFTVTTTADTGEGSLRKAIVDANDGDVILFDADTFPSNQTTSILLSSNIAINKQLTIDAGTNATPRVALDAQNNSRCLYLQTAAGGTIRGFIFCNASNSSNGGAVYCAATNPITFTQCRFSNNTGNTGGGLSTTVASTLTFDACTFSDNTANSNGGAAYGGNGATLTFDACEFSGNSANSTGGAAYGGNGATLTFDACTFSGNTSATDAAKRGVFGVSTCAVIANATTFDALYVYGTGSVTITGGVTTVAELTAPADLVVTIQDGAALTVTTAATIDAATFTGVGRAYLATATELDFSAATLTNVVACTYGAGLESFNIDADGASWTAQDLTTPILIETRNNSGGWDTLTTQASGGAYAAAFAVGTTARAFDGVRFFRAEISAYWQVTAWAAATNGAGTISGGDAATDSWSVTPITITPNLVEV